MKKKLLQKLAQFIDKLPKGDKRKEALKDWLELKLSEGSQIYNVLKKKYQF